MRSRTRARQDAGPVRPAEEQAVDEVEAAEKRLRLAGRAAFGVDGTEEAEPLRTTLKRSGVGWYPLTALSLLVIVDEMQGAAFATFGPEISRSLGISKGALAGIVALKTMAIAAATLPMAAFVQRKPRRAVVSIVTAFVWSVMTAVTGFARSIWQIIFSLLLDGSSTGSTRAIHMPLLMDVYPPQARVRCLSVYQGANWLGFLLVPLSIFVLTSVFDLTWRGVFVVLGVLSTVAALFAVRLRDPGFGQWDSERVRELVHEERGDQARPAEDEVTLGFWEIVNRLFLIPTVRRLFIAMGVLGMMLIPLQTYLAFFLDEEWGLSPAGRSLFSAGTAVASIVALAAGARRGEAWFRADPAVLVRRVSMLFAVGIACLGFAVIAPLFPIMVALFCVALALFASMAPALVVSTQGIIPANMRPHAAALTGIFQAAVGGLGGLVLMGGFDRRFGTGGALASLTIPGVIAMFILRGCAKTVNADLDRAVESIVEEEEIRALQNSGRRLPLLSCRGIDFSYDQVQVLFGVDFTVDDGEMVALLGTNGAGKSTLLRVISGLGLPSAGTVRFRGADVTYLDAGRRVTLGISQIAGGKATFDRLSVVENIRAVGYSIRRDRRAVDAGIDLTFETFPRLAERRNQPAGTLSGGERQMLALAKALLLQPRLLLVDELSLGLAPKVVAELLTMVRHINAEGASVVLVEQSVNVALSLVDHAYFMEKGAIRFDGRAEDLIERDDLLRSVFLEGAGKGLA